MGIAAILYLLFWLVVLGLIAAVVLACMPGFQVSASNVGWFVVGGGPGCLVGFLVAQKLERIVGVPMPVVLLVILLIGLIGGGLGLVALKTRLAEARKGDGSA